MVFENKKEAGEKLAGELKRQKIKADIILAIPYGSIPVAIEVAKKLNLPLDFIVVRKLPMPDNPEAGFGAVSEHGEVYLNQYSRDYPEQERNRIIKEQIKEAEKRKVALRGKRKLNIKGKKVIIIDDGLAMGSTMRVAVDTCKNMKVKNIVIAVPTCSSDTAKMFEKEAKVICLDSRKYFVAVAEAYEHWQDIKEKQALEMLKKAGLK